jgi:L-cysteine S-thiosulfotransferase
MRIAWILNGMLLAACAQPVTPTVQATGKPPPVSGYAQMGTQLRAMQDTDHLNPAFLSVGQGGALWDAQCHRCHGAVQTSMKGIAATFPKFSERLGKPIRLSEQVNACRVRSAGNQTPSPRPLGEEHADMLALTSLIGLQSRGMPLRPDTHPQSVALKAEGKQLFDQRLGQLNLSCAQCHDQRAGLKLGGALIPEGHPNAYPLYRFEWQAMGSLQRRLRNCMTGVRAEVFAADSNAWTALELHLVQRALGLSVETPGVRP